MKKKWYLQTWFICLLCAFWMFIVPAIVGIILLILQIIENRKTNKKYGTIDNLEYNIANLNNDIVNLEEKKKSAELSLSTTISDLNVTIQEKKDECDALDAEIASLEKEAVCKQYICSDYDGLTSEDCKNKLALLKNDEQEAIKSSNILLISKDGKKKEINDNAKQILRCFNSECDNALLNLSVKNIDSVRSKITKSFDSLNKIFAIDGIQMTQKLLEYKLEELNLVYTYEQKKELEREQQRAIKEQMKKKSGEILSVRKRSLKKTRPNARMKLIS
mgnify:CR=1 FL=1